MSHHLWSVALFVALSPVIFADNTRYPIPDIFIPAPLPMYGQSSDNLGNQIVLSAAEIQREGVTSLAELLDHVAGMRYDSGAGANPQLFLRGKPALILINGVPLTTFSQAAPDLNVIDLQQVQKIIITPGSAGVAYGDAAIGGVVNVITTAPTSAQANVNLWGGWPQQGGVDIQAANALANGWSGDLGGDIDKTGGYRQHSKSIEQKLNGMLRKDYDRGYVEWRWQGNHQNLDYPGALTAAQMAQDRTQSIASGQGSFRYNSIDNVVHWHQALEQNWISDTVLHHNQLWGAAEYYPFVSTSSELARTISIDQSFQHQNNWFHLPVKWTLGVNTTLDDYSYTESINYGTRQQYAAYALSDWQLPDQWGVAVGGRYVWLDTNGQFYEYNGAMTVLQPPQTQVQSLWLSSIELYRTWGEDLKTYLRRAQSYQLPLIDQSSYSPNTAQFLTGFGLQPQTATSYETGFTWSPAQWQWNGELYLMNVRNEIGYAVDPTVPGNPSVNFNLPPTRHIGALLGTQYSPTQRWQIGGQLNASRQWFTQGDNGGKQLPDAPEWIASMNSRYQFAEHWSMYGLAQYTGSSFADGDFSNSLGKIPGYWLFNTALNYQIQAWTLSARIDNLTNTYYNLYTTTVPTGSGSNEIDYYPAPGRTFLLSVNYHLEN